MILRIILLLILFLSFYAFGFLEALIIMTGAGKLALLMLAGMMAVILMTPLMIEVHYNG